MYSWSRPLIKITRSALVPRSHLAHRLLGEGSSWRTREIDPGMKERKSILWVAALHP